MFVYIVGNVEQSIFKLAIASDPTMGLANVQVGNPYKLSVISEICVKNRNLATLIEGLACQDLTRYEGAGGWLVDVSVGVSAQFISGHYLRAIADKAGVQPIGKNEQTLASNSGDLRRLSATAKRKGLTFQDVLDRVERAYAEGESIDEIL